MSTKNFLLCIFGFSLGLFSVNLSAQYDVHQFHNDTHEFSTDIVATSDGNYVALSFDDFEDNFESKFRLHLFKFSEDGSIIWSRYFNHTHLDPVPFYNHPRVIQLRDESFIILYANDKPRTAGLDPLSLAIKVDKNGNRVWQKTFECCFFDLIERDNGEVWLGGENHEPNHDLRIKRINRQGNEMSTWDYSYSLTNYDAPEQGFHISTNSNDEVILTGVRNFNNSDIVHFRIAGDGTLLSELEFGNINEFNFDHQLIGTDDGGSMYLNSYRLYNHFLVSKVDANGDLAWSKQIDTGMDIRDYNDMIPWNGGAVAVGTLELGGQSGPSNLLITFLNLEGNVVKDIILDIEGVADRLVSVVPSHDDGLMFFGWINHEYDNGNSFLNPFIFRTNKYGNPVPSSTVSLDFSEVSLFPNPSHSETRLDIDDGKTSDGFLRVFGTNGQLMYQSKVVGDTHIIHHSDWTSGLYFVHLYDAENVLWSGKLVVRK